MGQDIHGSFPELASNPHLPPAIFFSSYIQTYLGKITRIQDLPLFKNFIRILASGSGNIINYTDIGSLLVINDKTVNGWIGILQQSGIVFLLQPYFGNSEKRLTKSSKLYFSDTALPCALLGDIPSGESLQTSSKKGAIFETFVVSEIRKSFLNAGKFILGSNPLAMLNPYYRRRHPVIPQSNAPHCFGLWGAILILPLSPKRAHCLYDPETYTF